MWKAVIADDEGVILQGLKKLVDWTNMDVRLVGEARDGQRLKEVMEETDPDIVITDIMMPYRTGLDILRWCNEADMHAKFIFISGYQEFTYAKEALQSGAVDYLLKPVARKDLEDAVRKAIQKLEEQNTIEIFKEEDDEMYQLFREINDGQGFENDELYQLFEAEEIDFEGHFFVGICVGIRPDLAADMIKDSFERFNLLRFSIYNQIAQKLRGKAFVLRKDDCALHLMGVFPCGEEDTFVETYVMPVVQQVSAQVHTELSVGIGMYSTDAKQLKNAYKTAKFAFELYYFEEKPLIDFRDIHKDYTVSFEDYAKSVDEAYHAIIAHDESYLEKIDKIMDNVEAIHYGNKNAALSRVLYFAAEIGTKLFQYQLIEGDYNEMQEKLQKDTESRKTFRALRECIRNYYQNLWVLLDNNGKSKDKVMIEQVKNYIKAHYAEDMNNIRLKVLEYIIWGEKKAFEAGAVNYGFSYRREYLDSAMACAGYEELRKWFLDKMVNVCRMIRDQKEEQSNSAAKKAMLYIQENYNKDISLDDVSGIVNISPYYFSKIFKEETGENFIEYVTKVRIEKAKEFLAQPDISIKEAGIRSGYTDPNYFSRIFKKQTDMTPSEYKTRYGK